jgi:hypothetical protein
LRASIFTTVSSSRVNSQEGAARRPRWHYPEGLKTRLGRIPAGDGHTLRVIAIAEARSMAPFGAIRME